jgi:hypothetical protein
VDGDRASPDGATVHPNFIFAIFSLFHGINLGSVALWSNLNTMVRVQNMDMAALSLG